MCFCVFVCCNSDLKAHLKVNVSPAVSHGGQSDHSSSSRLLHSLQQQAGQQEVTQVVYPELDAEAVFSPPVSHQTYRQTEVFKGLLQACLQFLLLLRLRSKNISPSICFLLT